MHHCLFNEVTSAINRTITGRASTGGTGASINATFTGGIPPTGSRLILFGARIGTTGTAAFSAVTQASTTWSRLGTVTGTGNMKFDIWSATGTPSSGTVTCTSVSGDSACFYAVVFSSALVLSGAPQSNSSGSAVANWTSPTIVSGGTAIVGMAQGHGGAVFSSPTNSYTLDGSIGNGGGTGVSVCLAFRNVPGSTSTNITSDRTDDWCAWIDESD